MARDESLKRTNISEKDISTEWEKRGSRNKLTNEVEVMRLCPECNHHALALSQKAGRFHCWHCGIYGITTEAQEEYRKMKEIQDTRALTNGIVHRTQTTAASDAAAPREAKEATAYISSAERITSQLDDYMPLDDDELAAIEDISLDAEVKGPQLLVRNWLQQQKIPLEWAVKMRWGVSMHHIKLKGEDKGKQRACIVFRNYVEGYCCNAKFRCVTTVTKTNTKTVWEKGFEQLSSYSPCAPYNIDCINPKAPQPTKGDDRLLYFCEGEKDCAILSILGYEHVISAASGSQTDHAKSFEAFEEWLKPITTVIIVGDQDSAGRMMVRNLISYFDDKQVRVARWDKRIYGKDITEVYQKHGADVARKMVDEAAPVVREDIEDFMTEDAVTEVIESARGNYDHGYPTGVGPITDSHFKLFNLGGLIIVTGTPNTGKTDFLNYLSMSLVNQRQSHVCYCSFETPNKFRHAGDLTQIWAGGTDLTKLTHEEIAPLAKCVMSHITHIRLRREKPTPETVLHKADIVKNRHPDMEYLIIDPYLYLSMTEGRNITETESIKTMLTTVQDWAHKHHVWVFIVAHPRKLQKDDGSKELEEVDMYTIAGSANWANVADYVLSIKRIQTKGQQGQITADYTRLSVLKVRDQKICVPGDVYYNRQSSGRYDERQSEKDAQGGVGKQNLVTWR